MKLLLLGINFYPELTGIGKYTGEMAEYLTSLGHEVHVVTAPPYYPAWRVGEGYQWWHYRREEWEGNQITRCPLWVPRAPSGWKRIIHLASFALSSLPVALAEASWKPQVVLSIAPTILGAPGAILAARLAGAQSWLHIHDFELEAAKGLGLISGVGPAMKWAQRLQRSLVLHFDHVSTISESMLQALVDMGVPTERLSLLPNWVDIQAIRPVPANRARFGLPEKATIVLYAGNLGQKQGLEVIVEAAKVLQDAKQILFVIAGDGSARPTIERSAKNLANVRMLPLQPDEEYNALLSAADIHVLTERPGASGLVMPSKLGSMLASGRPVVVAARAPSELARIAEQVGILVPPAEPARLAQALVRLADAPHLRGQLGLTGRSYAEAKLSRDAILSDFGQSVEDLVQSSEKKERDV